MERRISFASAFGFFAAATLVATEKSVDPCQLVTPAEVQTVLGAPVAASMEAPRSQNRPVRVCNFRTQDGKMMNVYVGPKDRTTFDHEKEGHEAVSGIGDTAYGVPPGIVSFLKGSQNVLVQAMPANQADFEKVKALARSAAGRI